MIDAARVLFLVSFLCSMLPVALWATGSGTNAGTILLKSGSARMLGIGDAIVTGADIGGLGAVVNNAAAPGLLPQKELLLNVQKDVFENTYSSFYFGAPTSMGAFSGGVVYNSAGNIDLIDASGTKSTVNAEKDMVATFNYASQVSRALTTGLSLKFLRQTLIETQSANAIATDAGVIYKDGNFQFGISLNNAGSKLQFIDKQDPLPLAVRAGASLEVSAFTNKKIIFAGSLLKINDESVRLLLGSQYHFSNMFQLRAGFKSNQDIDNLTFGFSTALASFDLDYAATIAGELGITHWITVAYSFAVKEPKNRGTEYPLADYSLKQEKLPKPPEVKVEAQKKVHLGSLCVLEINPRAASKEDAEDVQGILLREFDLYPGNFEVVELVKSDDSDNYLKCHEMGCASDFGKAAGVNIVVVSTLEQTQEGNYLLQIRLVNSSTGDIIAIDSIEADSFDRLEVGIQMMIKRIIQKLNQ